MALMVERKAEYASTNTDVNQYSGWIEVFKQFQELGESTSIPEGIKDVTAFEELKKFIETGDYKYIRTPVRASKVIGRNDTCHCGSGKKYKKCCGEGK